MKTALKLVNDEVSEDPIQTTRVVRVVGWCDDASATGPLVAWQGVDAPPRMARWSTAVPMEHLRKAVCEQTEALVTSTEDGTLVLTSLVAAVSPPQTPAAENTEVHVDGSKVEITAENELILRCGEAYIRLAKDGRLLVRGLQVETRARGANRIRGGSVEIN